MQATQMQQNITLYVVQASYCSLCCACCLGAGLAAPNKVHILLLFFAMTAARITTNSFSTWCVFVIGVFKHIAHVHGSENISSQSVSNTDSAPSPLCEHF